MTLHFSGAADAKIDVGNGASLQLTGTCTIMCWVNLDDSPQNVEFVSKYATPPNRGFTLQTDDAPPDTYGFFWISVDGTNGKGSGWTSIPLTPGTWYHIAGQFVPSTAVEIWLNGVKDNDNTSGIPSSMHNPANNVTIGNRPSGDQPFDGKMDDIRIYNRNLSASEMATIYAAYGRDSIIDGLVGRWLTNEGPPGMVPSGADSVRDIGPYGNHGTPNGTHTYTTSPLSWRR